MSDAPPGAPGRSWVLAVSSNKGGVGKTTVCTNLAVYLRALREELPLLVVSLDDQTIVDRMFRIGAARPGEANLKHGWAERSLSAAVQLGEYGVHFVPSPPDVSLLKDRAGDPTTLRRILERTAWPGVVLVDTKSDLEALTQNAFHAADRIAIPLADRASLEEAAKTFRMLERARLGADRARVLITLVDRRTRGGESGGQILETLCDEVARRGWPRYETVLSRSPKVESLNSGAERPLSILHHARGTAVHGEMREFALEVLAEAEAVLRPAQPGPALAKPSVRRAAPSRAPRGSWTGELLDGLRSLSAAAARAAAARVQAKREEA